MAVQKNMKPELIKVIGRGLVCGDLWDGNEASYPIQPYTAKTKVELIQKVRADLENQCIQEKGGFQYYTGVLLDIEETYRVKVDGKFYKRKEREDIFIGQLTEKQQDHLLDFYYERWYD